MATNLFDHKSVALFWGMAPAPADRTNPRLRNTNLDHSLVQNFINLSAYRCYSFGIMSEPEDEPNAPIREIISNIKTTTRIISNKLTEVSDILRQQPSAESTLRGDMLISALYTEMRMFFDELPTLDNLSQLPKKTDEFTFFEALAEQTKLAGIKAQKVLFCVQNIKKNKLTENIEKLRTNFGENYIKITQAERELGKILDS